MSQCSMFKYEQRVWHPREELQYNKIHSLGTGIPQIHQFIGMSKVRKTP